MFAFDACELVSFAQIVIALFWNSEYECLK